MNLNSDFDEANRQYSREVQQEAAELVRKGVPPYDAIKQAQQNIRARGGLGKRMDAALGRTPPPLLPEAR